jgi:hypothetical protein
MPNRISIAVVALIVALPFSASGQEEQECRVLVAKDWIVMGAASEAGCLKFADEAATPGERQFAKVGETFLKVQGGQRFRSIDGGNTWEPIVAAQATTSFDSLNVLKPPGNEIRELAPAKRSAPKKVIRKKRRRSSTNQ